MWSSAWALRWAIIAVGAVLLGCLVQQLWSILLPVLLALLLTTALEPPAPWLESRLRAPPALAALVTILGAVLTMSALMVYIAPAIANQVSVIADSASDGLTQIQTWLKTGGMDLRQTQLDSVVAAAQDRLRSSASSIASGVLVGVSAAASAAINLLLTLMLSFFFLKDGRAFLPWLRRAAGPTVGGHLSEVGSRAWAVLGGFVRTQAMVGLIDAVLVGAGLVVLGVPVALPLALLTFVAAFAPIIGAVTVGALCVLVALVANSWVAALIVLVIVVVVQQLEGNVLLPWLQGKTLDLHAGVVLLAVVLGSTLFGIAGAFLAVPAVAVGAVVLRYLDEQVDYAARESSSR